MIMRHVSSVIARRYAQAFLRVYDTFLRFEDIQKIDALAQYLHDQRTTFIPLVRTLYGEQLLAMRDELIALAIKNGMPSHCLQLFRVLADDGRLFLIDTVLTHIVRMYKKQHGIVTCVVRSAHPLDERAKKELQQFLARKTKQTIIIERYDIDPRLIAGIRVQGETFLWEYSLDQRLREARLPFIR